MNYKILLLVFLTTFTRPELYAQCTPAPSCIGNPGIDNSTVGWGNPIGTSLPDWYVLSGTPTLAQGMGSSSGFRLTNGDGMYACYNFQSGRTYKVCLMAYNTNAQGGNIIIEAHNGTTGQIIGSVPFFKSAHPPAPMPPVIFTASSSYTQIRIYTNSPSYSVVIDDVGVIEVPVVTASPSTISTCQSATLSTNSANPLIISWTPTNSLSPTTGTSVTATPCSTTVYTATYSSGCHLYTCNTNNTVQVTVNVQPNGTIINNSANIPCGDPIDMQYAGNPCPNSTYKWTGPKNGNTLATGTSLHINSTTSSDQGTYMLIVKTPQGCADTFYTSVVMTGCCAVVADFDIIDCNPVRFINHTTSNGTPIIQGEWYWDFGDGNTSTLRNPSHLYTTQMGPTTVCMTAVASDGLSTCCSKICKDFIVCDWGPICQKAAFDYRVVNPATGDVQFLDQSTGSFYACGWTWKVNGIPQAWSQNPTITLGPPGIYHICLETQYCMPNGSTCSEEWCEDIIIP